MVILNSLVGRAVDVILAPLTVLPPLVSLGVLSLFTAIMMLLVFRATSDQRQLAAVKRSIHAALFEIRLFNDDLSAIWRAQVELVRLNLTYLRLSLVPMLWMMAPLTLVISQLHFYYGYDALTPKHPILVKAQVAPRAAGRSPAVALETAFSNARAGGRPDAAPAIHVDTPTVWLPAANEFVWRVIPQEPGAYELRVRIGMDTYMKTLNVGNGLSRRSPLRLEQGFLNQLLFPSEAPLPSGAPISAISVAYPIREIAVFRWRLHWMIIYFALSMLFAVALKKRFHVNL